MQQKVYFRWKPHITQFEFGSGLIHNSLSIKDQNVRMSMISPLKRFLAAVAADVWPHYKGYSGFKSGDGKVILKRLGPLMGRVSYKQEVLKSCNTLASPVIYLIVSLSWFKTFCISVWLLLMLLQLGPWRNHTSIYIEELKRRSCTELNSRLWCS